MRMGVVVLVVVIFLSSQGFAQENVEIDDQLSQFDYEALRLASIQVRVTYMNAETFELSWGLWSGYIVEHDGIWGLVEVSHGVRVPNFQDTSGQMLIPRSLAIIIPMLVDDEGNILTTTTIEPFYVYDGQFRPNRFFDGIVTWVIDGATREYLESQGYQPLVIWTPETQIPLEYFISLTSVRTYEADGAHGHFVDTVLYVSTTIDTIAGGRELTVEEELYRESLALDVFDTTLRKRNPDGVSQEMGPCLGYSGSPIIPVSLDRTGRIGIYTDELGRAYVVGSVSSVAGVEVKYLKEDQGESIEISCTSEDGYVFVSLFANEE